MHSKGHKEIYTFSKEASSGIAGILMEHVTHGSPHQ